MYSVYRHTTPDGKIYIGVTGRNPKERWNGKYYHNAEFSKAIKIFGWQNIKHDVLFVYDTKAEAYQKEQELIALYQSNTPEKGYNRAAGGHGTTGLKRSAESKEKTRQSMIGVKHTPERINNQRAAALKVWERDGYRQKMSDVHKGKLKGKDSPAAVQVVQLSLSGKFIRIFDSMSEAAEATGINRRLIGDVCRGRQKKTHGYKWAYLKERAN